MQHIEGAALRSKAEKDQRQRHVFDEIAVDADPALELGVAAAAERDTRLAAAPGDAMVRKK